MRLFSEEVKITSSNSPRNILQVKDFQEVFFGVFEVQINENKYVAEKISEENGNPIISVVVEDGDITAQYPFLLLKGKQEIYFNSESEAVEIFESNIAIEEVEDEEIVEIVEQSFDNIEIIEDKKQEIIEEIKRVKRDAIKKSMEILEQNESRKIQNIKNESKKKEKALAKYLESARENLVDEFTNISEKIKKELIFNNDDKLDEIRESVDLKIKDIADNLNESLKKNFQNSSKLIDKSVKQLVKELYESNINPKVDNELKNIAEEIVDKVSEIDKNLNNKLNQKADVSLIEGVNKELDAIRDANIELNNSLNKGVQKALSRVGNIDKRIVEITEKFDKKITDTEQEIAQYFDEKLSLVKEETLDITDEARKYFFNLIEESRGNLLSEIRKIKDEKPVEYILESKKGGPIVKDWDSIEKDWNKKIHDKFENYKTDLRKYIAVYASGGGTNATQYQDGGTMNGNLTVTGAISASSYLGLVVPNPDLSQYLPISGGTITGDLTVNNSLSANILSISGNSYYGSGATFTYETDAVTAQRNALGLGVADAPTFGALRVNGNSTIRGNLSVTGTTTFNNTTFSVTSALSVVHIGAGPAMYVGNSGLGDIASFYDIDQNLEVFHIGGANGSFPNVGVNTSEPNKDFTVVGEISATSDITTSGNVSANNLVYIGGNTTSSNLTIGTNNSYNLALETNGVTRMTILSSGNVGIGVASPTQGKLVIDAPIAGTNRNLVFEQSVAAAGQVNEIVWRSSTGTIFDYSKIKTSYGTSFTNSYFTIQVANSALALQDRFHINVAGNVGIGTTTPNEKLTVVGNISSSGTIIASNYNPGTNVAAFLQTPTSDNLRAALTDDTGTGANVFADNATLSNPTLNNYYSSSLPDSTATCVRDGPIPKFRLFEDFPNSGNSNNIIGTHGWLSIGNSGSGTFGIFTQPFANRASSTSAAGVNFISSGAVSGNYRYYYLNLAGSAAIGQSFQSCFAIAQTTACTVVNFIAIGGYSVQIILDIPNGTMKFLTSGAGLGPTNPYTVDIASGLTFATGNLYTGTRYRLYYKIISSTQIDVYLASAAFNSSTWTTMYSGVVTHSAVNYFVVENLCVPYIGITTSENVNKTMYVDWAAVERDIER
jgi:hypothetical protein